MTDVAKVLGKNPVRIGTQLRDKYKVEEEIASGTRGDVFRASRIDGEGRDVVLKVSDSDWEFRHEQWLQEKGLQEKVGSPKVVETFPLMRRPWTVCVMERLGRNLCMTWSSYTRSEERLRRAVRPMLEGLSTAHAAHVAHTDLKPLNICESADGSHWRLIDWGCAKHLEDRHREGKKGSGRKGAPTYQSPEMLSDQGWSCPTDIWSLGVTLAELYCGTVWDKSHPTLFSWPDSENKVPDVLVQMEEIFGRLPNRMRRNMGQGGKYGINKGRFFSKFPPMLADLLNHMFLYDPDKRITADAALQHIWFGIESNDVEAVERWLDSTFTRYEKDWKLDHVGRTSINAAIQFLVLQSDMAAATKWLQRAVQGEIDIDYLTFNAVIEGCFKLKTRPWTEAGSRWLQKMLETGQKPKEFPVVEGVTALAQDDPEEAEKLIKKLIDAEVRLSSRVFTPLASTYAKQGNFVNAESLLELLQKCDLQPDARFATAVMQSYANARAPDVERAEIMARFLLSIEAAHGGGGRFSVDGPAKAAFDKALGKQRWEKMKQEPEIARRLAESSAGRPRR